MANSAATIHRPRRSRVEVSDPAEMREFLQDAYGVTLRQWESRIGPLDGSMTHARTDVGPLVVDDVYLPGETEASADPVHKVVAVWATDGKLAGHCDDIISEAAPGDVTLVTQPDLAHYARAENLRLTSVLLDPSLVASVATGLPSSQAPLPIRFLSFAPVDATAGRLWKDAVSYVKNSVLADDTIATPLVLGHSSRLLAAVTLSTFPNSATAEPTPFDRTDHYPALLRRAIEFIDANAGNDISSADIAAAIHVTPRAVQYMFRRQLETTPLQYIRKLRLHHAHQDLQAADRAHDTVTAIAARWGFMHTGRFAVLYRQTYGHSPHTTLRG
jgi:AraC-like DNA-binding protein